MSEIEKANARLRAATDAFYRLTGERRMAFANGDAEQLRRVRQAWPGVCAEQRAASDALREAVMGEATRG